jgi:hypothetical protein
MSSAPGFRTISWPFGAVLSIRMCGRDAAPRLARQHTMPICRLSYGSDGTRTRDLRRDRPLQRSQRAQQCTRESTVHAVLWWLPARLRMATRRGSRRLLPICCPLDVSMLEAEVRPRRCRRLNHFTPNPSFRLDVFGKTEAAGQRGVGEEGDLVDLAAAQGEHHHAPGLRAQVAAEGRLAVGAGRAYL